MRIKISNPYKLLRFLAITGAVVISLTSPFGGHRLVKDLIRSYFKKQRFRRSLFLQDLQRLQKRKLISYKELLNSKVEITITKNGQKKVLAFKLDDLKLFKPEKWDKLWRLVMFDIPHSNKKARDALRRKLKDLKFYPLQKSVFLTPYPCEDEIDFIGSIFNVRKHILILYVSSFENEAKIKNYFNL